MASSKDMLIENIAPKAKLKGLNIVGTGDAFHLKWLKMIGDVTEYVGDGIYQNDDVNFILTTEVEAKNRIHHLIFIPDIDIARELSDKLPSKNKTFDGRPKTNIAGEELIDLCHDHDCLVGPAHAFTPWTGMYKTFDSIYDCYGMKPDFVELGLSADTDMADCVNELKNFPFLTNSDAHSPWPHRLGREFNQIKLGDISYSSIKKAILKRDIVANYGLYPDLGKYHMTACTRCFKLTDPQKAKENKMKCSCGGIIKKGVDFRIFEIADSKTPNHPSFRPPYYHLMPLAEIISSVLDKGVLTKSVQTLWQNLIDKFGCEINVLVSSQIEDIQEINVEVAHAIEDFRNNMVEIIPGGGGKYGEIVFKKNKPTTLDNF